MENISSTLLEGLNAEQKLAVECVEGPVLIVAGAGSGKTRVLTTRIANILSKGVDPTRVLALTFTKKAASEMKERVALMVGERKARRLVMGTFHSIFIRFLREYSDRLGYPAEFTIYDTSDSVSAIKACLKELSLDDKVYKPKDVLSRISMAKNNLVTDAAYRSNQNIIAKDTAARKPKICDIYSLYSQKCRKAGVMDFDDILLNMNILLRDHPDAKASIAARFDYIMVDEYQDTNFAQYLILRKLGEPKRNLCVVGDDSQSIYAFRGAKIENILNFKKDYPECRTFRLERNYRSTANIVNAANSLIAKNENRIPKTCVSMADEGEKIHLLKTFSEQEEAIRVASDIIARMQSDHSQYQDFAILYRTNSQSRALEEALRKRNLPYMIYSGNSFFDRAEVKDMMAYMKLVVNINDDESFKRIVNTPARGIGDTTIAALGTMANVLGVSMFKAVYSERFAEFGLKAPAMARLRSFCEMISSFTSKISIQNANDLVASLSDACGLYASFKSDSSIESQSRASNIEELLNSAAQFVEDRQNEYLSELESDVEDGAEITFPVVTLGEFLESTSLLTSADIADDDDSTNKIALMTVHSAKGLEFAHVFVTGMEENLFPSGGMLASPSDIEEERRLFYVALTRAKKTLSLAFAQTRMRNGKHESNSPSRFLKEIDSEYISNPLNDNDFECNEESSWSGFGGFGGGFRGRPREVKEYGSTRHGGTRYGMSGDVKVMPRNIQRPAVSSPVSAKPVSELDRLRNRPLPPKIPDSDFIPVQMTELKVGQRIEHNRFGYGKILEITGTVPDLKAKISFDDYGEKILLLKYAKIRFI